MMRADDRLPSEMYFPSRLVSPPAKWEEGDRHGHRRREGGSATRGSRPPVGSAAFR